MSIWGRLAAATEEISPGATLVHVLFGGGEPSPDSDRNQDNTHENALPFTAGMIALGAKMAKSDGVITRDEVGAFRKAFNVSDGEMKDVARVFNLAKEDSTGYEACADQLVTVLKGDRRLLDYVLEGLFHIGTVDGVLHPQEEKFLRQVAKRFGITDAEFDLMKARFIGAAERDPYDVLGLKPSVSNEELKSRYQRLIAESQPDEVMARGMPKEFVRIPTAKLAAIEEAYETIGNATSVDPSPFLPAPRSLPSKDKPGAIIRTLGECRLQKRGGWHADGPSYIGPARGLGPYASHSGGLQVL